MIPFKTKRHFFRFYLVLALMFLLTEGFGLMMVLDFSGSWGTPEFKVADYLLLFMGSFLVLFGIFLLIMHIRNVPIIVVNQGHIKFGNLTYYLKEIALMQLTGKYPFGLGISLPAEGACLTFKDGQKKYIFDSMYTNGAQLKRLLENLVHKTPFPKEINIRIPGPTQLMGHQLFKGNPFINFRATLLWLIIGFSLWELLFNLSDLHRDQFIFLAVINIVWFLILASGSHYFGLTSEYFIVRNHYYFWKNHVYPLGEIKEIIFEINGKAPNSLRLITKDYQTRSYPASPLRDKTWLKLKEELVKMNITVRNEAIPENTMA